MDFRCLLPLKTEEETSIEKEEEGEKEKGERERGRNEGRKTELYNNSLVHSTPAVVNSLSVVNEKAKLLSPYVISSSFFFLFIYTPKSSIRLLAHANIKDAMSSSMTRSSSKPINTSDTLMLL